jgi:hypothetical protein
MKSQRKEKEERTNRQIGMTGDVAYFLPSDLQVDCEQRPPTDGESTGPGSTVTAILYGLHMEDRSARPTEV